MLEKNYPKKQENYDFWVSRLNQPKATVCTNDKNLNVLEGEQIAKRIKDNCSVLEVGCGNGGLFEVIAEKINLKYYLGTDFVKELVDICNKYYAADGVDFIQLDMTEINDETFQNKFDYIISKRAIQNVLDSKLQLKVIESLGSHLNDDGVMIFVESSSTAQANINEYRKQFGLEKISPPFYNLFLDDDIIKNHKFNSVKLVDIDRFAGNFYFITRVIYARLCKEYLNESPSYDHPLNAIGLSMEGNDFVQDFSQSKTYIFRKS